MSSMSAYGAWSHEVADNRGQIYVTKRLRYTQRH